MVETAASSSADLARPSHDDTPRRAVPASIVLRPIASGLPFGLFGLVNAAALVGVQAFGILPASASTAIGMLLLPTVILQLVGGISCILGRDVIAASMMLTFSGVWLGTSLVLIVQPHDGLVVLGIWYFAISAVILGLITSATGKLVIALVPVTGLPTFLVTAVWLVWGGSGMGKAAGVLSFALAAVALYAGLALLFEDARRRTVLPTLRRGAMKRVFTGDLDAQLENVEHEAGVRQYL